MRQFCWDLRLLVRNRAFLILMFIYTTATCLAIFAGHQRHEKHISQNAIVEARYQDELQKWRGSDGQLDPGYVGYYQFVPTAATPSPWAALFSGEQAEHNWHLRVRLLAFYGQAYAGEIQHYDHWILGHFDLGFVWIYLLPIVIGLLSVNIIADEKNSGRWSLLRAQTTSPGHFLVNRLRVIFAVLLLLNTAMLVVATATLRIPVDATWGLLLSLLVIYQLFWFSIAAFIARGERNATFNVLAYCCIWLAAALALPGIHYLSRMNSVEMDLGIAILMEQREQMNDSWDRDKNADFARFLELNPQWRNTGPLPEVFHWKWYYAMQSMSDAAVQEYVDHLKTLRSDVYRSASTWAWLSPVTSLQQSLTAIAGTGGLAHQHYLDQVKTHHQILQNFFYPHYFFDEPFPTAQLTNIPVFEYRQSQFNAREGLLQLGFINLIVLCLFSPATRVAAKRFRKGSHKLARSEFTSAPLERVSPPRRTSPAKAVE